MSNLFDKLGKTQAGHAGESLAPRVTLAVFGKHPGWDDHMPGIGLDTETLAYIKQTLYVSGIGRQIDSGAWEKLEADKRTEGFDHTFLWLRAGHLVLGQVWSSKDGKGRSKYPMLLCVDCERVSPSLLLNKVRPGMEALRDACKAAGTGDQVASHCRTAQEQLRMLFTGAVVKPDPTELGDEARRFLERPELGPDRLGLLRVLHELSGKFDTSGGARGLTQGAKSSLPSLHLRVPWAADTQNSALLLWTAFLRAALSPSVPLILVARGQSDWLDIVVGEPTADDFFFLQASPKGVPLVTQIPYELAPGAMTRLREIEARFRGNAPPAPEAKAKAPPPNLPPTAPPPEKPSPPAKQNLGIIAAIVGVVVLIGVIFVLKPQHKNGDQNQVKQVPEQPPQPHEAAAPDPYQLAMKSGREAFERGDYANALAAAGKALSLKSADAEASHLRDDAQTKLASAALASQKEADYQAAMKEGRGALTDGDYAKAVAEAGKALSLKPADAEASHLRDDAQTKLASAALASQKEADYQSAMKEGRAAWTAGDFAKATAEAEKALSLKPADAEASHLHDDAQTKIASTALASQKEADYQAAMKEGRAALTAGNFAEAVTEAGKALSLKPDDAEASHLRDDAQTKIASAALASQKEADYQSAMSSGLASLSRGDYADQLAQAQKALLLKPNDADAMHLRDDARTKIGTASQKEAAYQADLQAGRGALAQGDYKEASAQADKALSLKPDDAEAKRLRDDAQTKLASAALTGQKDADYRSAIITGRGAFARGDYKAVLAEAEKALALKPNDADATQMRNEARLKLGPEVQKPAADLNPRLITNSIDMEFVWIPGAGAYFGKYEVTEQEYRAVMGELPGGRALLDPHLPVANVTFQQAVSFCEALSKKENRRYSLPTKQQWLSAAGLTEDQVENAWDTLKASGALEHEVTDVDRKPEAQIAPVGSRGEEKNGLCDMLGNVREWVMEQQRAGFSFQSTGVARKGKLFLDGSESQPWIQQETGFRCILLGNQPP